VLGVIRSSADRRLLDLVELDIVLGRHAASQ
jgi:hypothetical protein